MFFREEWWGTVGTVRWQPHTTPPPCPPLYMEVAFWSLTLWPLGGPSWGDSSQTNDHCVLDFSWRNLTCSGEAFITCRPRVIKNNVFFNNSYTQYIICIGSCSDGAHNLIHEVSYFEAFKNGHLMDMVGGVAPPNDHYLPNSTWWNLVCSGEPMLFFFMFAM
jgi:hypothetical protein